MDTQARNERARPPADHHPLEIDTITDQDMHMQAIPLEKERPIEPVKAPAPAVANAVSSAAAAEAVMPPAEAELPSTQSTFASIPWKWLLPVVGLGGLLMVVVLAIVIGSFVSKLGIAPTVNAQTATTVALLVQKTVIAQQATNLANQPVTRAATIQPTRASTLIPTKKSTMQPTPSVANNPHDVTQMIRSFSVHRPLDLAFSPDSKTLAAAPYANYVSLWEIPAVGEKSSIGNSTGRWIFSVAFSPDSKILATGGSGWLNDLPAPEVTLWDAASGALIKQLWGHKVDVHRLAFSPDGSLLASGSGPIYYTKEGEVILWEIPGGNRRALISTYTSAVSLAFSPDSNILAVGTGNEKVMLFDTRRGTQLRVLEGHKGVVVGVAFSSDGSTLVSASQYNQIIFWNVNTGEQLRISSDPLLDPQFSCMALSSDGKVIATGSTDKIVRLWDFETGNMLRSLVGEHLTTVDSVAYSPDGTMLASSSDATGSEDGRIILWGASK
jgi:sugar lactone lactonase YvrE